MSKDLSEQSTNYCSYCPKMCHFSCQVANLEKNEALSPWGKQQNIKWMNEKLIDASAENYLPAFKCLSCMRQQTFCDHDIIADIDLQKKREEAVAAHKAPEAIYEFAENFKLHSNPYQRDLQVKLNQLVSSYWVKKSEVLFYPTCHLLALNPNLLLDFVYLCEYFKIKNLGIFSDSLLCCGQKLWNTGCVDEFKELAHIQYSHLKHAKQIIVGSPECAWAFKELYPQFGFKFSAQILTFSEFILPILQSQPFKSNNQAKENYFYHDACYQGRSLGDYDSPRKVLELVLGFSPQELSCSKEEALCSGGGGCYEIIEPENSDLIAKENIEDLKIKGGKTLVTSCPKAAAKLRKQADKVVVKDLIQIIAQGLRE